MPGRVLSAHNPMTGPRHLGHYASTMMNWPKLAAEGELIVIVDDLIAALLYPNGRTEVESRTLSVVREFMALDVDFSKHHIVLTSMVPEAHELAFYASLHLEEAWCQKLYRESFAGLLSTYQRAELGLPHLASLAEMTYPQCHLAALTLGLGVDYFQGGEEMRGYMHIMDALASKIPSLKAPKFLAEAPFILGTDGHHMASENAVYVSASRDDIEMQISGITDRAVLFNWASAMHDTPNFKAIDQDSLASGDSAIEQLRSQVSRALVDELKRFSVGKSGKHDLVEVLERSSAFARIELAKSLAAVKKAMKITGFA